MVGGGNPFYLKFCVKRGAKSPVFSRHSFVAPQP